MDLNSEESSFEEAHSDELQFLHISRPMWIVAAVVLGVTCLGKLTDRLSETDRRERVDLVFGSASSPSVSRLNDPDLLDIKSCKGTRFYTVQSAPVGDESGLDEIRFVDPSKEITGWIRRFATLSDDWPPFRNEFDDGILSVKTLREAVLYESKQRYIGIDEFGEPEADASEIYSLDQLITPLGRRVQVTDIEYDDDQDDATLSSALPKSALPKSGLPQVHAQKLAVRWAHPVRSAAWPVRVHLGRCTVGEQTLLIGIQEWAAKTSAVDYQSGIFESVAKAIRRSL